MQREVLCTLHGPLSQAGGYADMERHVPELYDWVKLKTDAEFVLWCAIMDVVSWFPWGPATTLDGRRRAMPARRMLQRKRVETRARCELWRAAENEAPESGSAVAGL